MWFICFYDYNESFSNTQIRDIGVLYNKQNLPILLVSEVTAMCEIACRNGVRQYEVESFYCSMQKVNGFNLIWTPNCRYSYIHCNFMLSSECKWWEICSYHDFKFTDWFDGSQYLWIQSSMWPWWDQRHPVNQVATAACHSSFFFYPYEMHVDQQGQECES